MSLSTSKDAIFDSLLIRNGGVIINDTDNLIPGTIRFNTTNKTFEGYTGEPGPLGETWRELTLDIASADKLGGIRIGANLFINDVGVLSTNAGITRLLQNIVTVAKEPHGADYTTIADALNYIADISSEKQPSATNQYKIIVTPGIYTESVILPDYVSLQGEGEGLVIIRRETGGTTFENSSVIICGHYSRIENIEIQHYQGTSTESFGISAFGKSNVVIQNVTINIGHPTDITQTGANSIAIHLLNSNKILINNTKINITQGEGILYGLNVDMTYGSIIYNTEIKIDAPANLAVGIYHQNLSDGQYNMCNVDIKGAQTNTAVYLFQSSPSFNSCKLLTSASILDEYAAVKAQAYGFYNHASVFQHQYITSSALFTSNPDERDTITLASTVGFTPGSYIKIAGAIINEENKGPFYLEEVTSTQLILGKNKLKDEAPIMVEISQLYTIDINASYIQATHSPIFNLESEGYYFFKGEKSVIVPGLNGPLVNNGIFITEQYHTYIVSQEGGDFNNLYDAMESISDNSQYNRYTIIIKAGIFIEKYQIIMKPYVNVIGAGQEATILSFDISSNNREDSSAIILSSNSEISQLTIKTIATTINSTYRIGIYGDEVSNLLVDTIRIISTASEHVSGLIETTSEGVFLNNPSSNIILRNLDIEVTGSFNNAGIEMYSTNASCPTIEIINGKITVNDTEGSYNYGILSNRITYNMIGTKITVTGSQTDNSKFCYGLKTVNEPAINEYLIQFFSVDLIVSAIVDQTNYAIYTSNYQTIIGGGSNIVGTVFYTEDSEDPEVPSYKSSVKLFTCWSVSFNGTQIVFNPLSGGGAPISGLNGNLFVGDNAGNISLTGHNNTIVGNDSGYMMTSANNSTLLGFRAGESISEGNNNTFLGKDAGRATNTGDNNTFTGYLSGNTNRIGSDNTAYGSESLKLNYSGERNVAIGRQAGYNLTVDDNVLVGFQAGYASTTAQENIMIGSKAGLSNTTGDANVLIGHQAGITSTNSNNIVSVGHLSGFSNTGNNNTFIGKNAGYANTTGEYQTMIGYNAGLTATGTGNNNTMVGAFAGSSLTNGSANTLMGVKAGQLLTSGAKNLVIGSASNINLSDAAGNSLTTGSDNIILGTQAAKTLTNGNQNVIIGNQASQSLISSDGTIAIGYASGAAQTSQSGDIFIGNQAGKNNNNVTGNLIMIGKDAGSGAIGNLSTSIMIGKESGENLNGSYNIGIGYQALQNATINAGSASGNVFVGHHAGMNITTGNRSVGIGGGNNTSGNAGVLSNITNQSDNTAIGYLAGQSTTSSQNTLIGSYAGNSLINGGSNTLIGYQAGKNATTGGANVQIGANAGLESRDGINNTLIGSDAGNKNISGSYSVAIGNQSGYNNLSDGVVSIGYKAGYSNTSANNIFIGREVAANPTSELSGEKNIMIGYQAGYNATTTVGNILIGEQSGFSLTTGSNNILIGDNSGNQLNEGEKNIFIGSDGPGSNTTSGSENIFIGSQSGAANTTGSNNLFIGNEAGVASSTASDNICIGNQSGYMLDTSQYNLHIGSQAGFNNMGERNISIGYQAGFGQGPIDPVTVNDSICIGFQAGLQNQSNSLLAIGTSASSSNISGENNISIGGNAGRDNVTGSNNILIGENAGAGSNSNGNIFIGKDAGINNVSGGNNMIIGNEAGAGNFYGNSNIFLGYRAGNKLTTNSNIAIGNEAGYYNINGQGNIYLGYKSGRNAISDNNTFIGNQSGQLVTTGQDNLFLGNQSGRSTTTGSGNFFIGYNAGYNNNTGNYGLFAGYKAGEQNTSGTNSLFVGYEAGAKNTTGTRNLGIGFRALKNNQTGNQNIAIGSHAMYGNKLGLNNLVFGANAVSSGDIGDNNVVLGSESSRIILNPSFANNIAVGYKSNFQGFASSRSIIMGANAVGVGAGGENNIIMGENSAVNLGLGNSSTSPTSSSNVGATSIKIGSSFVKAGQHLVLVYDNNSEYEPQIVYTTAVTASTASISSPLTWFFGINDKAYLLFGEKSSVIETAISGEAFVIVKTPKTYFDSLLPINTKIVLQSIITTTSQVVTIVSTEIQTGNATTGTTKINIDQALTDDYVEGDVLFLGRLKDDAIGELDGSLASSNIVMGFDAGNSLTMGSKNIAIGDSVLRRITTEKYNTALGTNAGYNVKSENNLLLGTRSGYNIDTIQGTGSNTMIGYAAGLYSGKLAPSSNNLFIGNRVGQVNQGSNNILIGNETQLEENENSLNKTTFSNKLAIYNSDGGIPSNPLIGGDLSVNRIGIATMEPTSTLDVKGSFGKAILAISQFSTVLSYNLIPPNYTYDRYLDKTLENVYIENNAENIAALELFQNSSTVLIDSEFIIYNNKFTNLGGVTGLSGLTGLGRGSFNTTSEHHIKSSKMYDMGSVKGQSRLTCDVPTTGIITVNEIDKFILTGVTALAIIDSEIIQFSNKNTGLGNVTRGFNNTPIELHDIGSNVYNIATSLSGLNYSQLTNDINNGMTNIPINPTGFFETGGLIIDSEIMTYTDNKPYLFNISRGTNETYGLPHLAGISVHLIQDATTPLINSELLNLIPPIEDPSQVISISNYQNFYSSGFVTLDGEIIKYEDINLLDIEREQYQTSKPASGYYIDGTKITYIADGTTNLIFNFLDQELTPTGLFDESDISGLPANTIILRYGGDFPDDIGVTHTILIDKELITYNGRSNNFLLNCVRGQYGSQAASHLESAPTFLITDPSLITNGFIKELLNSDTEIRFQSGHQNFPTSGLVLINTELIKYNNLGLFNLTRGFNDTSITGHNISSKIYNFELYYGKATITNDITTDTQKNISINDVDLFTTNGTILVDSELMTYYDGVGLRDVTRGYLTSATGHITYSTVFNIPTISNIYSSLNALMNLEDTGIPTQDNTSYGNSGLVLINSEIMSFESKNTLDNVVRGSCGTIASAHSSNALISQTNAISALTFLAGSIKSYDDTIVMGSLDGFTSLPLPDLVQVQTSDLENNILTEVIQYSDIGLSLVTVPTKDAPSFRGAYGSTSQEHSIIGATVYKVTEIGNVVNLASTIEIFDITIPVSNSDDITGFSSSGNIRVGYEIMNYQNKNLGLGLSERNARGLNTGATSHLFNTFVYDITYNDNVLTMSTSITGDSKINTTDSAFPVIESTSSFGTTGYLIVNNEIINYTSKNNSLVISSLEDRGLYYSSITTHNIGTTAYQIVVSDIPSNIINNHIETDFIPLDNTTGFATSGQVRMDYEIMGYSGLNNVIYTDGRGELNTSATSHLIDSEVFRIAILDETTLGAPLDSGNTSYLIVDDLSKITTDSGELILYDIALNKKELIKFTGKNKTGFNYNRGVDGTIPNSYPSGSYFNQITNSVTGIDLLCAIDNGSTYLQIGVYSKTVTGVPTYNDYSLKIPTSGIVGIEGELISYTEASNNFGNVSRGLLTLSDSIPENHSTNDAINSIRNYNNEIVIHDYNYIISPELPLNYYFTINNITSRNIYDSLSGDTHTSGSIMRQISNSSDVNGLIVKYLTQEITTTTQTTLKLNNLTDIPDGSGQLVIKGEIMTYTKVLGATEYLSVIRGAEGTTPSTYQGGGYDSIKVVFLDRTVNNGYILSTINLSQNMLGDTGTTCNFISSQEKENNQQLTISTEGIMLVDTEAFAYNDKAIDINNFGDFTSIIKPNNETSNYAFDSMTRGSIALNATSYTYDSATIHPGIPKRAIHLSRDNNPFTEGTLASSITSSSTTINITITNVGSPENVLNYFESFKETFITINGEIIKGTAGLIVGSSVGLSNCIRGYLGTSKVAASSGDKLFKIYEPYEFYINELDDIQSTVYFWPGNMQLNVIGSIGYIRVDNEIMKYSSTIGEFTNKLLNCERHVDLGNRYPPISLVGLTPSLTVSGQDHGNGLYTIEASSQISTDYQVSNIFNSFDINTILGDDVTISSTTDIYAETPLDKNFPSTGGKIIIDNEIISYTSADNSKFIGITRAQNGTTASAHSASTSIKLYDQREWRSDYDKYDITTGNYIGTSDTIDGLGNHYLGEYVVFSASNGDIMNNFYPNSFYLYETLSPSTSIAILGSRNGSTWTLLSEILDGIVTGENYFIPNDTTNAYGQYRCVIMSITPGITYASLKQFAVYGGNENGLFKPIFTLEDWNAIIETNANLYSYMLMNDITTTEGINMFINPNIGGVFTTVFNGNNKTITASTILEYNIFGLFLSNIGIIKNLNITLTNLIELFTHTNTTVICSENAGIVENCNVNIHTNQIYGGFGGIIVRNLGQIINCQAYIQIDNGAGSINQIGGIASRNDASGIIKYCKSSGNIRGRSEMGGLVGQNNGTIQYCYSDANIYLIIPALINYYSGAFIGNLQGGIVTDCYCSASTVTSEYLNGFIGYYNSNAELRRCYFSGIAQTIYTPIIGFIAEMSMSSWDSGNFHGQITDCVWNIDGYENASVDIFRITEFGSTGEAASTDYIKKRFTSQLIYKETYHNYNFLNVWKHVINHTPILLNMTSSEIKNEKFTQAFLLDSDKDSVIFKTSLRTNFDITDTSLFVIDSTIGILDSGYILIENELIKYCNKNDTANMFYELNRGLSKTSIKTHTAGTLVYFFTNIPKKLFVNKYTVSDTEIEYDLGPGNGYGLTNGGIVFINTPGVNKEIIRFNQNVGYNLSTHNANDTYIARKYEEKNGGISGPFFPSDYQYITDIITTSSTITNTDVVSDIDNPIYYYLAGNSLETDNDINLDITTSTLTTTINPIDYNFEPYPHLSDTIITITESSKVYLFNNNGGHVLLAKYSGSTLENLLLIRYKRAVNNILYNVDVSIEGPYPNFGTTVSFTHIIYMKTNDTLVDPYEEGPLFIGQNEITTVIKDKIPVYSSIIGLSSAGVENFTYSTSNSVRHRNVTRYTRSSKKTVDTSTNYNFSQLIRIDSQTIGFLTSDINNSTTIINNVKTSDTYGVSGFALMNNEMISFEGFGLNVSRGILNTLLIEHQPSNQNYIYNIYDDVNTITTSISDLDTEITITDYIYPSPPTKALLTNFNTPLPARKAFEIINNGQWNKTINGLTRNYLNYNVEPLSFNTGIKVYNVEEIEQYINSSLKKEITSSSSYIQLNNGDNYAQSFTTLGSNTKQYILIDKEFIKLTSRYSIENIIRNYFDTQTAPTNISIYKITSINGYSKLRQNITDKHLFIPLLNGSLYSSSAKVLMNGEWINFISKNSFDIITIADVPIKRGLFGTDIVSHSFNQQYPVLVSTNVSSHGIHLRKDINSTSKVIPLDDLNTSFNTTGLILIDKEFMSFNTKKTFDLLDLTNRGLYQTFPLDTTETINFTLSQISINSYTNGKLRSYISDTSVAVPLIDSSNYEETGLGLLEGEFFFWFNKKTLDNLSRGMQGTIPLDQNSEASINVVARLSNYQFVNGSPVINFITIEANDVLLSDEVSGIRIKNTADIDNLPPVGTVLIGNEKITYNNKETIIDLTRGTNGTTASSHVEGTRIYNISNAPYYNLVTASLAISISTISSEITLDTTDGFGNSGYIIIGSEIISYTSKNSTILYDCERGKLNTSASGYSSGQTVYYSPLTLIGITKLDANMKTTDKMLSVLSVADLTSNPSGLLLINSEIIKYESIADLTRGTNTTTPSAHLVGAKSYTISTTPNIDLNFSNLDGDIISTSNQIVLLETFNFGNAGYVIIDSEIIQYNSKDNNTLYGCTRGKYNTTPSDHSSGSFVYYSPLTTINYITLTQNIDIDASSISLVTSSDISTNFNAFVLIDSEIIKYETSTGLGKLIRGVLDTTSKAYSTGEDTILLNVELSETESSLLVNTDAGDMTINLPSTISIKGRIYTIKKTSAINNANIVAVTNQKIDTSSTMVLKYLNEYVTVQSDGSNWVIIASNVMPVDSIDLIEEQIMSDYPDSGASIHQAYGIFKFANLFSGDNNQQLFTIYNNYVEEKDIIFTQVMSDFGTRDRMVTVTIKEVNNGYFKLLLCNTGGNAFAFGQYQRIAFHVVKARSYRLTY